MSMKADSMTTHLGALLPQLGLLDAWIHPYGRDIAKIDLRALDAPRARSGDGRLVLVTAISPTMAGEGKTTTTIGLGDALHQQGQSVCIALREPSLGPCMGVKGGATGGGLSRLTPSDRINLHFTGDFHAITSAHNLIAAALDNHLHFRSPLDIDPRRVLWPRVMDMNDRALREVVVGLGGSQGGVPRQSSFHITAASEVMAMLALSGSAQELRARVARTLVAFTVRGEPVTVNDLGVTGVVMALLRDALMPNLVQTLEGTPALVHCGPFANIAHGCGSVIATRLAMHTSDWTVTEAGFGSDLGGEKFHHIKCRSAGLAPDVVVIVATARALKLHGGADPKHLNDEDLPAIRAGMPNLSKHIENMQAFGAPVVVAINRFASDTADEVATIQAACDARSVPCVPCDHFARGGAGALLLADAVRLAAPPQKRRDVHFLYALEDAPLTKLQKVARTIYGARDVLLTPTAEKQLKEIQKLGLSQLPICIAKTQMSLTDDPSRPGRPSDFDITVRGFEINTGAGFLVALTGELLRMPGLPRRPQAELIDLSPSGEITGLT
jgi:formate--tetrahydrofolate ligase